jgi:ADP-ribosylglycohydrolase
MSKHLTESQMSYLTHAKRSAKIGALLFAASIFSIIHAVFPNIFIKSSTNTLKKVKQILDQ